MITIRRAFPVAVALTFVVASCGGSSDEGTPDTGAPATSADTVDDEAEIFTEVESTDQAGAPDTTATDEPTQESAESAAPAESVAPSEVAPVVEPVDEPVDGATVGEAAAASVDVTLEEWAVNAPTEYGAGPITFNASNGGNFPHEFVVIEGEGYEALPLAEGGAVIEDDLPTGALIGRTGRIGGGSSEALTVTLAPGNYVLLCNLGGGSRSHAGQGQRLDITVS